MLERFQLGFVQRVGVEKSQHTNSIRMQINSILHSMTHTARNGGILARVSKIKAAVAKEFTSAVGMTERHLLYQEADADLPHHYTANSLTHVTEVVETHPPVWPASRCT